MSNYPDNMDWTAFQAAYGDPPPEDTDAESLADFVEDARKLADEFGRKLHTLHELDVRCGGGFSREDRLASKIEWLQDVITECLCDAASHAMAVRIYKVLGARHG